jgi:hypothetical protein
MTLRLGFVVNVHGPLNYDIDFSLSDEELEFFGLMDVEYVPYDYEEDDGELQTGKAHRARLGGLTHQNENTKRAKSITSQAFFEINRFLDRSGGFVRYEITGVDIFLRTIVNLYDPVSGECLNDLLLQEKYDVLFKKYTRE